MLRTSLSRCAECHDALIPILDHNICNKCGVELCPACTTRTHTDTNTKQPCTGKCEVSAPDIRWEPSCFSAARNAKKVETMSVQPAMSSPLRATASPQPPQPVAAKSRELCYDDVILPEENGVTLRLCTYADKPDVRKWVQICCCQNKQKFRDQLSRAQKIRDSKAPNMIQCEEVRYDENGLTIEVVTEAVGGFGLADLLGDELDEGSIINFLLQWATALQKLHERKIAHGNVGVNNVLFVENANKSELKAVLKHCATLQEANCSANYVLQENTLTPQCDMWCLGILAYCLATTQLEPLVGLDGRDDFVPLNLAPQNERLEGVKMIFTQRIPLRGLCDTVVSLLNEDPKRRSSAADVVKKLNAVRAELAHT